MAIGAHPDDIEFLMAGTLARLKNAGYEIHYLTIANGSCGSLDKNAGAIRSIRERESRKAARLLGAVFHPSLVNDLEVIYGLHLLRRLTAVIREVAPRILLVHSPQDYMEDHEQACRLAVSAAFARGMRNFRTLPVRAPSGLEVTVYHAMPYGLHDSLRRRIIPEIFVDTTTVHPLKRAALEAHASQREWLDATQGLGSYLQAMDEMSEEMGRRSAVFRHAEGWRRHLHLGFCARDADPLGKALKDGYRIDPDYEKRLEKGA